MHLSGLTVSFVPTNAIQFRNAHDYLKDFRDEKRVYEDSGKMIDFFHNWKCDSKTLEDCIHKLLYDLVTADFWLRDDAEMMEMYLDDLKNLGYVCKVGRNKKKKVSVFNFQNCWITQTLQIIPRLKMKQLEM